MNRLREQYKTQQQHVLKLLELLDIGNCVNLIRDDCQRTESAIFDHVEFCDVGEFPVDTSIDKLDEDFDDNDDDLSNDTVGEGPENDGGDTPEIGDSQDDDSDFENDDDNDKDY